MEILPRDPVYEDFETRKKASTILKALEGLEICTAVGLLEGCQRYLLTRKIEIVDDAPLIVKRMEQKMLTPRG